MQSRRKFIVNSIAVASMTALTGCARDPMESYQNFQSLLRARLPDAPNLLDLVRYATLAPSGHNTQPWFFLLRKSGVSIRPDPSRRTPIVDPYDHHLFVSLGCAAENFLIAAAARGMPGAIAFNQGSNPQIDIELAHGPTRSSSLCQAIPLRQSTRSIYDGHALSGDELKQLEAAARIPGVSVLIITDSSRREVVLDHVIRGNDAQMNNPAFVRELQRWIRFNPSQALATGDGLFSRCSGQATVPAWIGNRMFGAFFTKSSEDAKYTKQIRSSAGIAVFVGAKADPEHWVNVGRSFERFALQATALGIRYALINQPVEVPVVRASFAKWLDLGDTRPDLVVRFGMAAPMPMSTRRPVASVIVS